MEAAEKRAASFFTGESGQGQRASSYQTVLSRPVSKSNPAVLRAICLFRFPFSSRLHTSQRPFFSSNRPLTGRIRAGAVPGRLQPFLLAFMSPEFMLLLTAVKSSRGAFARDSLSPPERKQTPNGDSMRKAQSGSSNRSPASKKPSTPCTRAVRIRKLPFFQLRTNSPVSPPMVSPV